MQGTTTAEPLVLAVYEEVLRAGGLPILQMTPDEAPASFFELASDEQLDWVPPTAEWAAENADVRIALMADANSRALSQVDPKKQARSAKARKGLMDTSMKRSAAGEYRWALTLFPTHAYASEAGMSLAAYEDFYYAACLATDDDPVTAWQRQSDEVNRLSEWMDGKEEVHITAPGTDIKLNVSRPDLDPLLGQPQHARRRVLHRARSRTRWRARSRSRSPPRYGGREVSGVKFRFEGGKVVDASAERGEDFLIEMLDTDDGRAPPGRARASAPTTASPPAPRRSCSTRRSAARCTWRSARATPSRAA